MCGPLFLKLYLICQLTGISPPNLLIQVRNAILHISGYSDLFWPLIEQVAELTRTLTVRKTGKTSHEVVYLITPLTAPEANPQRLLALVRRHWSIENSSHYVRDVTSGKDRSRLRSGQAPHILATLRNLAIILIHRQGSSQIAATRRHFASRFSLTAFQQSCSAIIHKPCSRYVATCSPGT